MSLVYLPGIAYWVSVLCLFGVAQATQDRLDSALTALASLFGFGLLDSNRQALLSYAPSLKGLLFLISLAFLLAPIARDMHRNLAQSTLREVVSTLVLSLAALVLLGLLVFHLGNINMGEGYALRSLDPFGQMADWYNRRLLMPATAHVLFFRGGWLYFAFGLLATACFLAVVQIWFRVHAPLPFWQFISLCTSSFVISQFQSPGYPDILTFTFLALVMSRGFSQESKTALLVLALATHEGSLFIGTVLAWRFLDRRHFASYMLLLFLYGLIWLAGSCFQIETLLSSHHVRGMSSIQWVIQNPKAELLGLFVSFKVVWVLPALSVYIGIKRRQWRNVVFVSLCGCVAVLMTFLGVDTSRMAGWAFPAVFISLQTIHSHLAPRQASRLLSSVFLANLLIPSFRVGLNSGIVVRGGGYSYLYDLIMSAKHLVEQSF